jgi:hypothetical protein
LAVDRSRRFQASNSARRRWQIRLAVVRLIVASWPKTSTSIDSTSRSDSPRTQQEMAVLVTLIRTCDLTTVMEVDLGDRFTQHLAIRSPTA